MQLKPPDTESSLKEGIDFYIDQGNFVFTATYLLKRNHCCGSGCRHCPYENPKKPE
ncbi:MAG: hypothetical protein IPI45_04130 [Saprospiraceae bacterium]|nr:hypothetical protein [Saprospiraceae bacterium]MBK7736949.1 hypothetical protein [Saprospiraceae bacterium]MBK7914457.1 hypothetical protein [Saprospiraceae bacterium]